jgi:hypothetical protein
VGAANNGQTPNPSPGSPGYAAGQWGGTGWGGGGGNSSMTPNFLNSSGATSAGDFGGPGNNAGNLGLSPTMAANLYQFMSSNPLASGYQLPNGV